MLPLWDDAPNRRPATITSLLIAVNIAVFVVELVLSLQGGRGLEAFIFRYALVPERLTSHWDQADQWLTVFTSMFLHGGVAHVLSNCWFLRVFGRGVENRLGGVKFFLLYFAAGIGAATLQVAMSATSNVPMLGASGAISGVLGAYFVLSPGAWVFTLVPWFIPIIPLPAFVFLLLWFALQMLNGVGSFLAGSGAHGGTAWWAHAGGFITGVILAYWAKKSRSVRRA
jgi:membrane associated rhomboid family serine protease